MRTWIKLYTEIVSDPKLGRLSDRQFRTCINLFALAGMEDEDGALPEETDLAWHLRMSQDELVKDLQALAKVGIVTKRSDKWIVTKWSERQAKPPSASRDAVRERVKRYRDKQDAKCNDNVTTLHENGNAIEEEEEQNRKEEEQNRKEEEQNRKEEEPSTPALDTELSRALRYFENEISTISGSIATDMADMWDLLNTNGYTEWWYTAIKIAVSMNKRRWSYVRGILQTCLTEGRPPGLRTNGNGKSAEPKYRYVDDVDEAGRPVKRRELVTA